MLLVITKQYWRRFSGPQRTAIVHAWLCVGLKPTTGDDLCTAHSAGQPRSSLVGGSWYAKMSSDADIVKKVSIRVYMGARNALSILVLTVSYARMNAHGEQVL